MPTVKDNDLNFDAGTATCAIGPPTDWSIRTVRVEDSEVVFTRTVSTDPVGNPVVSIESDCDDPAVMLLTKKGDSDYWNGDVWSQDHRTLLLWCADITLQMLREGLIATDGRWLDAFKDDSDGIRAAMHAAGRVHYGSTAGPHGLTGTVAMIRGLRLLQTMAPSDYWEMKLGGYEIPGDVRQMLKDSFYAASRVYSALPQPPWGHDPPWGPQRIAGHATEQTGAEVFVGEQGDLIWRALTETDRYGRSALKEGMSRESMLSWMTKPADTTTLQEMVVAAALYDETAEQQLTTGLFDGVDDWNRPDLRDDTLEVFADVLDPPDGAPCRWTANQRTRIRSFVDVVEGLDLTAGLGS